MAKAAAPVAKGGAAVVPGRGAADFPGGDAADAPGRGSAAIPGRESGEVSGRIPTAVGARFGGSEADAGETSEREEPAGGLKGARGELRRRMRAKRRLRVLTLVSLSVVVLGLLPLIFGLQSLTRDPVFNSLDALSVPGWADKDVEDRSSGSRWCFLDCRFRERVVQSQKPFDQTDQAYAAALKQAGWAPRSGECTDQPSTDGKYTCWTRDEFTLDLWVREPECAVDARAAQDPSVLPSVGPDGVVPTADPKTCVGSTVSIKVQNAVTDSRGKPQPAVDPSLIGETPDPVPADDSLLDPTPTPS
ncbi:hypothetical protein [Symbioplanes lichenis]|uniref:hypothetical protein n=1 Tax=Symbioplanes lichenis TaxID=1629072 RepID=UPI0027384453|nr:hypothetical protein [Actinoplanes lichenis]